MQLSELKMSVEFIVVDDNYIDHFLVKKLLEKEGYQKEVLCFTEPAAALLYLQNATIENSIPCILFLDINMPGMNGFEFMQSYGSLHKPIRDHYKIVMLSSSFFEDDIAKANADTNVKSYRIKPLTVQKIEAVLEQLGLLTSG
jgi:two-component SAPR family response regulator